MALYGAYTAPTGADTALIGGDTAPRVRFGPY